MTRNYEPRDWDEVDNLIILAYYSCISSMYYDLQLWSIVYQYLGYIWDELI